MKKNRQEVISVPRNGAEIQGSRKRKRQD